MKKYILKNLDNKPCTLNVAKVDRKIGEAINLSKKGELSREISELEFKSKEIQKALNKKKIAIYKTIEPKKQELKIEENKESPKQPQPQKGK